MSKKLSLNEITALYSVLEFIEVKDLLTSAMDNFYNINTVKAQDNADVIFKAVETFLQ